MGLIWDVDADVVVLIEVDERWVQAMDVLGRAYPHQVVAARDGYFGIAVLSKYPLEDSQFLTLGRAHLPSISARFRLETANVWLVATHPYPPSAVGRPSWS